MAINRFRQIIPVRSNYVPQTYVPDFAALATTLGSQQQTYDQALAVGEKVPKHYQSPEERMALEDYMSSVRSKIDGLAQSYSDEGVSAGNRRRKELLREISRDWQPGGKADIFQKRLETIESINKKIDETYDDPRVANYYKNQIQISPYEEAANAGNYGIGNPNLTKVLSSEEKMKYYDQVVGNISADQIVGDAFLDRNALKGLSFKDLLVRNKTKFIDWNKAAMALAEQTTPEILASEQVLGEAYGLEGNQSQIFEVDEDGMPVQDKQGRVKFANTSLGQLLQGITRGTAFQEDDVTDKVITNDWAMWKAKRAVEESERMSNLAVLTQPFNTSKGMFADKVEITEDGAFKLKGSKAKKEKDYRAGVMAVEGLTPTGIGMMFDSAIRGLFGKDEVIKDPLNSPQLQNTVQILEERGMFVKENENGEKIPMNEQEKINTLGNYFNQELDRATISATSSLIFDEKQKKLENSILFNSFNNDNQATPGFISNLKVYSQEDKSPVSGTELMKQVKKEGMPNVETKVSQPESMLPYGTRTFQIGDKEYRAEPLMYDKQKPEYGLNMMYRAQQSPLNNFSVVEELPPMPQVYTTSDGRQVPNGLGEYINSRGTYKMEYTTKGFNIYRKEGSEFKKLNNEPLNRE
jgi:hypothetical protein